MSVEVWTWIVVGLTFALYIYIGYSVIRAPFRNNFTEIPY